MRCQSLHDVSSGRAESLEFSSGSSAVLPASTSRETFPTNSFLTNNNRKTQKIKISDVTTPPWCSSCSDVSYDTIPSLVWCRTFSNIRSPYKVSFNFWEHTPYARKSDSILKVCVLKAGATRKTRLPHAMLTSVNCAPVYLRGSSTGPELQARSWEQTVFWPGPVLQEQESCSLITQLRSGRERIITSHVGMCSNKLAGSLK